VQSAKVILSQLATSTSEVRIVNNYLFIVFKLDGAKAAFDKVLQLRDKWGSLPQFMRAEAEILYALSNKDEIKKLVMRLRSYC